MVKALIPALFIVLAAYAAHASDRKFGLGIAGGAIVPIVQDDEGRGSHATVRATYRPISSIGFDANLTVAQFGDPDIDLPGVTSDLKGSRLITYGVDAIIGGGPGGAVRPFFIIGAGYFRVSRDQTRAWDRGGTEFGYSGGLGLAIGLTRALQLDLRTRLNIVPAEGSSSRKSAFVQGGFNYYFRL
jgi:hypothetical protein